MVFKIRFPKFIISQDALVKSRQCIQFEALFSMFGRKTYHAYLLLLTSNKNHITGIVTILLRTKLRLFIFLAS